MIKKFSGLFIILPLLTSCGLFIKLDQPDEEIVFKKNLQDRICHLKNDELTLATSTSGDQNLFEERIVIAAKKHRLQPIDVFVIWSLVQMYIRPDKVSPGSNLQFIDSNSKKPFYSSYNLNINKDPNLFLNSLKDLLKKYKSKRSLKYLARVTDDLSPYQTSVDKELATLLTNNKGALSSNKLLETYFFKGDQVLRPGEGLRTFKIWPIVSQAAYKNNSFNTHLFSFTIGKGRVANCNFDMRIYQNAVYLIDKNAGNDSHSYSISYKGETFLGISSQRPNLEKNYSTTYTFPPKDLGTQKAVCFIKTPNSNFTMISTKGRDSGQHLFNMIEYNIAGASTVDEVLAMLEFPRYLFLLNPERMVYESDRSTTLQTQTFLNTSFPIYHKSNLGNVWIHYKNKKESSLLIDDRVPNYKSCLK
ncbi:hypothetical protein [Halobacteriovorax sp. JY17]|uniref:hypothetical protein n=1 Tax=Halobacteriovorax sp. JY17 TaxID=2014617 RepID=UPI000C4E644E|nr:hypothetical protein [Halobacteriovorax sp. JY17]PIK15827.1 MAG: hypothetical protein CES88_03625 [Halobacteriovorax sp. JY17]